MARKKRVSPAKPGIWVAVWDDVSIVSAQRTSQHDTLRTFTIARTAREAERAMSDGLLGLPGVEGSAMKPREIQRYPLARGRSHIQTVNSLLDSGYRFVFPYGILDGAEALTATLVLILTDAGR